MAPNPRDDASHSSLLTFTYPDDARAAVVASAVQREAGAIDGDRTVASVSRDGSTVEVYVRAADLVALRAGHTTWCSLVAVAERAAGVAARHGGSDHHRSSAEDTTTHTE